ncbi:MAG: TIGR02147 family protein, partial [Pseudobdellovibrionaceae bacterium]
FSLRAFSKRLGLSPSVISEVLKGKRNLSEKMMTKILDRLEIAPTERLSWAESHSELNTESKNRKQLSMDQFQLLAEGIHFSILSLLETSNVDSSSEWMAARLGFSKTQIERAIERLLDFEMIEKTENGDYKATGVNFSSPDGVSSLGIRKSHRETLEWAQESLDEDAVEMRDFTSMSLAVDPALLPEIKKRIREFMSELSKLANEHSKTEVYKVAMQVFPLSTPVLKDKK